MTEKLEAAVGDCIIANPSRYDAGHPHYQYRVEGEGRFPRQLDWERHYLLKAAFGWETGCIVFWLPHESRTSPRDDGDPYAMDTRGEIGEWRGRMMADQHLRVVMGAEAEFPGLDTIRRNTLHALNDRLPILDSMDDVVIAAKQFADPRNSFAKRVLA